jgi:hypothetical protein
MREAKYTKPITISLQAHVYAQIKRLTDEQKISIGEWFRSVAEKALAQDSKKNIGMTPFRN